MTAVRHSEVCVGQGVLDFLFVRNCHSLRYASAHFVPHLPDFIRPEIRYAQPTHSYDDNHIVILNLFQDLTK